MDINICINRLGLNGNRYRLNQSNPPHYFIEWSGSDPQPTEAELQSAWDSYVAEQAATEYKRLRAPEYPAIGDQLDAILKHLNYRRTQGDELTQEMDDIIGDWLAVKARFPKNG
jgi:hypothetical protein